MGKCIDTQGYRHIRVHINIINVILSTKQGEGLQKKQALVAPWFELLQNLEERGFSYQTPGCPGAESL